MFYCYFCLYNLIRNNFNISSMYDLNSLKTWSKYYTKHHSKYLRVKIILMERKIEYCKKNFLNSAFLVVKEIGYNIFDRNKHYIYMNGSNLSKYKLNHTNILKTNLDKIISGNKFLFLENLFYRGLLPNIPPFAFTTLPGISWLKHIPCFRVDFVPSGLSFINCEFFRYS